METVEIKQWLHNWKRLHVFQEGHKTTIYTQMMLPEE